MKVTIKGTNVCTIDLGDGTYLQSYRSIVAYKGLKGVILYPKWDYSRTTAKHVSQFLGKSSKEIRQLIKNNVYTLEQDEPTI